MTDTHRNRRQVLLSALGAAAAAALPGAPLQRARGDPAAQDRARRDDADLADHLVEAPGPQRRGKRNMALGRSRIEEIGHGNSRFRRRGSPAPAPSYAARAGKRSRRISARASHAQEAWPICVRRTCSAMQRHPFACSWHGNVPESFLGLLLLPEPGILRQPSLLLPEGCRLLSPLPDPLIGLFSLPFSVFPSRSGCGTGSARFSGSPVGGLACLARRGLIPQVIHSFGG
ncbi:hypothetical protein [Mangrovicoccus ximenensis]|uniref:hypothetical protein n=1 Tax=Mangrovicoccus ximenensis TaxID=1911570 RepID=UPI001374F6CB|nr:hypothetical protein [Mangrovicoccus ximenensis]